ncbi:MAG TPA: TonB-dependent receptor [Vicinamibacterales bacterium]|nr:TonB-dependent receptor [Vicinamibacterales bacterium]
MKRFPVIVSVTLAWLSLVGDVCAQSPSRSDGHLKDLSLEELMDIDVTGVLRRNEPLFDSAAAVDVIYADEIRRSGAATLTDLLRMGAGLFVAQRDGRTWAVSARGFNTSGNKLLVLIDGRSIYTPLFSGVFWDVQDLVLDDIERIEIIRGPGATLWGANAVNGVINIVTKPAARTMEGLAQVAGGNEQRALGLVRYGDELGRSAHYRLYAKYRTLDALAAADGAEAGDPFRSAQIGGRLDWNLSPRSRFTLSSDGYVAEAGLAGQPDLDLHGANVIGRWTTEFENAGHLQVQAYYDRTYRLFPDLFEESRGTWDLDVQYRLPARGRHGLLVGGSYRVSRDETTPTPVIRFDPPSRSTPLFGLFVQDEIAIVPKRVGVLVGARLEKNDFSGFELQPTARVRWKPRKNQMVWAAVSRAVRLPTRLESDAVIVDPVGQVTLRGSDAFEAETLVAFEAGYRAQPHPRLALDFTAFGNRYDRLRSLEPQPDGSFLLDNLLRGRTSGIETQVNVRPAAWMLWDAAFTAFSKRLTPRPQSRDVLRGVTEENDPEAWFKLRGAIDLPRDVALHVFLRSIGALPNPPVPAYTELDLRVSWSMTRDLSLAVAGRNLLHDRHPEFGSPVLRSEIERSIAVQASLVF